MRAIARPITRRVYPWAERVFRQIEQSEFSRGSSLLMIPPRGDRSGGLGTTSYGEWCYTIGIFQSLIALNVTTRPLAMLDVGCGVGRLYLASRPMLAPGDTFVGLDTMESVVAICRERYKEDGVSFIHAPASNAYYAKEFSAQADWPLEDASKNLVTALSVWTHLGEQDWRHYLREVARVLAPGGRALMTFFVLDALYRPNRKTPSVSRYYPQPQSTWIFDKAAYGSKEWFCPSWVKVPEVAIAVTEEAFHREVSDAGLHVREFHAGQWKDQPGLFFQDVAVLEKLAEGAASVDTVARGSAEPLGTGPGMTAG